MYKAGSLGSGVIERILDMFAPEAPWAQRLWRPSAIDALRHCLDLIEGQARDSAKGYALQQARARITSDLFIPPSDRGGIIKSLNIKPEKMTFGSATDARLRNICSELEDR